MSKKFTKEDVPQDFTLGMAAVDAIPVVFFGLCAIRIAMLWNSKLFLIGGIVTLVSGAVKVLWKAIVAVQKKNIWPLFIQMRIAMPIGFLLMLLALIVDRASVSFPAIGAALVSSPSVIFFVIGLIGMVLMCVFAKVLDSGDAKSNWIEQLTNGIAQIAFFVGLCLL